MRETSDMVFDRYVGDIQASLQIVEELEHILEDMRTANPGNLGQDPNLLSTQVLAELKAA